MIVVVLATIAGYLKVPAVDTLSMIRWEMGYMIVISGVLALFGWNAGNRALTPINGILFINLVPVITFVTWIVSGYNMSKLEVVGAVVTIAALVSNDLYQQNILRSKSAVPVAVPAVRRRGEIGRGWKSRKNHGRSAQTTLASSSPCAPARKCRETRFR